MGIFGALFKRNKEIEVIEEKVNALSYEKMLEYDKSRVNKLSDQLVIIGGVLNFISEEFSNSINVEKKEDYPLIQMKKITKEDKCLIDWEKDSLNRGVAFISTITDMAYHQFYTHEGVVLFIRKYYEIREKHLKELFPNN